MKTFVSALVAISASAIAGVAIATLNIAILQAASTPPETTITFRQYNTHWSDHVRYLLGKCSEAAFLEQELAYIQGGSPEQQHELANAVFSECINKTKIAV